MYFTSLLDHTAPGFDEQAHFSQFSRHNVIFNAVSPEIRQVDAVKPATQKEIYKRLCIAKDVLHSDYHKPLDLSQLSAHACLSTPQLIRQFKSVFGRTPYQYLIDIRLQHAAYLLVKTADEVRDITWASGFNDPSAFCRAFRTRYGTSPGQFRAQR